jgi:hypothetical protein
MTAMQTDPIHRVHAAVRHARDDLASVADGRPWSMTAAETAETFDEVEACEAQLRELKSRLLLHAETVEVPAQSGATSVANWVAHRHKLTRREAYRQVRLAKSLETHPLTSAALAEGRVNLEQAEAILRGLGTLPEDLDPDLAIRAEEHLLELAKDFDAKALRNLSRRLLEVIAPDLADAHEAQLLEREERDAAAAARFSIWEDGHGKVHGRFTLDALSGAMLKKALFALAAPKHRASKGPLGERRPSPERLGQAFTEYVQRYPANKLPDAGGLNATVVVLMDYDTLLGGLKAAKLDTGEIISPALARKLACDAGIIPAVLGGRSEVLDLGRKRRFHSKAQRIVATIEQGGCLEEGCDAPPAMTQMHHPTEWSRGGETNRDAWLLCPAAHRRVHNPAYTHEQLPNGKIRFHRRT